MMHTRASSIHQPLLNPTSGTRPTQASGQRSNMATSAMVRIVKERVTGLVCVGSGVLMLVTAG
ncbi:hypothetical protein ACFU6I_25760 [Streptomyces sp. NPDC057486]|uniref:hypothetical protein n=1 Tax=Streptomyces sp. NPDC057486 TaxID=3346145 RepID=UPI0036BEE716